jgi:multicomponent Na+:H+ antiporter subunit E
MMQLFFFNVFLGMLWIILFQSSSTVEYVIGFIVAFGVLSIFEPRCGRRGLRAIYFVLNVVWQVIVSSIELAWVLIQPQLAITPGIVAIPLDVTSEFEIATLASAITLTPGTLSVDTGRDTKTGQRILFVHTLFSDNPGKLRARVKDGFERQILEISRGAASKREVADGK